MADPPFYSLFQLKFLTGENPLFTIDDEFLRKYTKVFLRSEKSEKIWKVKLDGNRLSDGWKEFSAVNNFRDGDVLVFKHDGDDNFHVSVSSRSISCDKHHASSSYIDIDDDDDDSTYDDDDDEEDEDDGDDDEEDEDDDDDSYDGDEDNAENISVKKKADSSSSYTSFVKAHVTHFNLQKDRLDLCKDFKVFSFANDNNIPHEIDLVNEQGRRWTLRLAKNRSTGVFYIRNGWENFCYANKLSPGDLCKFKLAKNGERPVLWLCPQDSDNDLEEEQEEEECPEVDAVKNYSVGGCSKEKNTSNDKEKKKTPSRFLTLRFTPSRNRTGQLSISTVFTKRNGIKKPGDVILLNKDDGRKWSSYLQLTRSGINENEWFYLRRGWREMCEANGVKVNDSFVLELIWKDPTTPMFKFFSKIENKGKETQRTYKKRACETDLEPRTVEKTPRVEMRVSGREFHQEGQKRRLIGTSNQTNTHSRRTQPKSCSVSDQVTNVKQGIVATLNTVKQFRLELETREQNLKASLMEIDLLGEKILGISKILNNTLF